MLALTIMTEDGFANAEKSNETVIGDPIDFSADGNTLYLLFFG